MVGLFLFNWFTKLTAWPIELFAFHTKIYYEDRKVQGRHIKGRAIIISNHTSVFDYAVYIFVFLTRTLRFQMAEVLFRKKFLGPLLKMLGGIYVNRDTYDMSFMGKSQAILDKGGVVGVFPEARIPRPEEKRPLEFKPSVAYLAYLSGAPIIPIVTNGSYFNRKKRARVLIGKPIDIGIWWDPSKERRDNLSAISNKLRKEIIRLTKELNRRQEQDELRPRGYYFFNDLIRITAAFPAMVWFRPKVVYSSPEAKKKYKKGVIFFSNHTGFGDPLYIMVSLWYRRINFVTSQEIMDNPKMHFWFDKGFRAIAVDRDNVTMESFKKLTGLLQAGAAVGIFPEGHIKTSNEQVDDFKNGLVLMALKGKATMVPIYVQKRKHWYNRLVLFQGEEIDLRKMYGDMPSMSQIEEAGRLCRERELELANLAKEYYS